MRHRLTRLITMVLIPGLFLSSSQLQSQSPPDPAVLQRTLNIGGIEAENTGVIRGIVKIEGEKRPRPPLPMTDAQCLDCWPDGPPLSETYVWGDDDTLQNVIVYISKGLADTPHPQLTEPATLTLRGCVYTPHVLAIMTQQPLHIMTSDAVVHNVTFRSANRSNPSFNIALIKDTPLVRTFAHPELAGVFGGVAHPWENARLAVFDHPYFAVTQQKGTFEIRGLPPGRYEVSTWHEIPRFRPDQRSYEVIVEADAAAEVTVTYQLPSVPPRNNGINHTRSP